MVVEGQVSAFGGLAHSFTWSETQQISSSLKSNWVIQEGDLLMNFGTWARGAGICDRFPQGMTCWLKTFFLPSFTLASQTFAEVSTDYSPSIMPARLALPWLSPVDMPHPTTCPSRCPPSDSCPATPSGQP